MEHVTRSIDNNEEGKVLLYREFDRLGLRYVPTYANFIFVDFGRDSQGVFEGLQLQGIIGRTIKEYGFPTALRLTIGTERQNRKLVRAIETAMRQ